MAQFKAQIMFQMVTVGVAFSVGLTCLAVLASVMLSRASAAPPSAKSTPASSKSRSKSNSFVISQTTGLVTISSKCSSEQKTPAEEVSRG